MIISDNDLKVFSDLGSAFSREECEDGSTIRTFTMDGENVSITTQLIEGEDILLETSKGVEKFIGPKGLFSSKRFSDLLQWARNQKSTLKCELPSIPIETTGTFRPDLSSQDHFDADVVELSKNVGAGSSPKCLYVTMIDGPAGIGKTTLIKRLSLLRAEQYPYEQKSLVLHVESRGRVLQNITDLISASLHSIRAKPTCEQLIVLIKHGLILLSIDGFDELADPNGYQMAWSQLDDLLSEVEGQGQVVLSGRETFVSPGRMKKSLPTLEKVGVVLSQYTMREVPRANAKDWLRKAGWTDESLQDDHLDEIFSEGSYASRPFFLFFLSDPKVFEKFSMGGSVDLLTILSNSLIRREVEKFGEDILRSISADELEKYVRAVNEEIARDMADSQGESLPGQTITFIADMCIPEGVDQNIRRILAQRACTLPFLTKNGSSNSFKFSHRQYYIYFLGRNAVNAISDGETPKYIKHNILGAEFLEGFEKVLRDFSTRHVRSFQSGCIQNLEVASVTDRSAGNLSSLLVSSFCSFPFPGGYKVSNVSIDELYLSGQLEGVTFKNTSISSLYAHSTDFSEVVFESDCHIVSLHVDEGGLLPPYIPMPVWIETPVSTLVEKGEIEKFLRRFAEPPTKWAVRLPANPKLITQVIRYRSFWLKLESDNDEPAVEKITKHRDWPALYDWLREKDLIRIEKRSGFAGKSGTFIHFRRDKILKAVTKTMKIRPLN